jgi:hypothetical protein
MNSRPYFCLLEKVNFQPVIQFLLVLEALVRNPFIALIKET